MISPSRFDSGQGPPARIPGPAPARRIIAFAFAVLLALTFSQHSLAVAAPGDPDLTFHPQGWKAVPLDIGVSGFSFALQNDGRMVVAGTTGPDTDRLVIHRLLADGSPDLSFNGTGTVITDRAVGYFSQGAPKIALQPDGKILAASLGSTPPDFTWEIYLHRFLPNGTLDPAFGGGSGFVTTPIATGSPPDGLAMQSDGRILVATFMSVWRFLPSGTRDTSFVEPVSGGYVKVLSDDKILTCQGGDNPVTITRLLPGGIPDPAFGVNGTAEITIPPLLMPEPPGSAEEAPQIEVLQDGRIWIGGALRRGSIPSQSFVDDLFVIRLLPDGKPDTSFNRVGGFNLSGAAVFNNSINCHFCGILPQPGGALVLAGNTRDNLILTYIRRDGTPDPRFGTAGRVVNDLDPGSAESYFGAAVTPAPERHLLLAGLRLDSGGNSVVLRRYINLLDGVFIVESPRGTVLENAPAQPVDFGTVPVGTRIREFTLRNAGWNTLSSLTTTLADESHPGEYAVSQPLATTLTADGQTTFQVTFTPLQSPLPRTATLRVTGRTGDAAENSLLFSTVITGRHATPSEVWRYTWFGATDNAGTAADLTDFDHDGLVNLLEYALAANPHQATPSPAQIVRNGNVLEYTYTRPAAALTELDYVPEAAARPAGPWITTGLTSTVISETAGLQTVRVTALAPDTTPARFIRLRISRR